MKTIIAGGRNITHYRFEEAMNSFYNSNNSWTITELVSGGAKGIDSFGEEEAECFCCPVKRFIPDWKNTDKPDVVIRSNKYGKYNAKAGHDRNEEMAEYADALVLIWDGKSKGSSDMKKRAIKHNLKLWEYIINEN